MRTLMFVLLASLGGHTFASEIDQANAAYAAHDYPRAFSLYQQLAAKGDLRAQVRSAEMMWYGEGVAVDRDKADALFARAAAAGDTQAVLDLQLSLKRRQQAAAINYWITGYKGEDLVSGKFACPAPALPVTAAMNRTDIEKVGKTFAAWRDCYAGFFSNLGDAMPAGKRIPAEVSAVMSESEFEAAKDHLREVYARVLQQKKDASQPTVVQLDNWIMRTTKFNEDRKYVGLEQAHWMKEYYYGPGVLGSAKVRQ